MPDGSVIGVSGVCGTLAAEWRDIDALASDGLLSSAPGVLREFGFNRAHMANPASGAGPLVLAAARAALEDAALSPTDIDLLIWAGARPESHVRPPRGGTSADVFDGFRYQSAWLQEELGLDNADVLAVAQQGCSTMFSALRVARSILISEPSRSHALCVGGDVLPAGASREILYNVISDGACAVVLSRDAMSDRWVGFRQISCGFYADPIERAPEIMAAYFPLARQVILETLDAHGLRPDDIDIVIPTGVNQASWSILTRLVGIPEDRVYRRSESFGHTILADNFIHLHELRRDGLVRPGQRMLLFTYGFGSSWCALVLEH